MKPNEYTLKTLNISEHRQSKMRTSSLRRMVEAGDVESARALMDKLKDNGKANVIHFNVMLEACEGSGEMRRVIETEMPAAGLKPDVFTFTTLVQKLMFEGDLAGARRVVEKEMPAAGVEPDNRTLKAISKSDYELSKMRTSSLRRMVEAGDVESARALMDKLKDNGKADVILFNVMLLACEGSAEMRRVIETEMPAAGLKPNVVTFNTLVYQLVFEGDLAGARRLVEKEMPAAGVEPDDRTLKTLNISEHELSKMRTSSLKDLLKAGDEESARALMDKLKNNGKTDVMHFNVMLLACEDSGERRRVIETEMPAAGLKPNVVTFTTLVQKLMFEGDLAGRQRRGGGHACGGSETK